MIVNITTLVHNMDDVMPIAASEQEKSKYFSSPSNTCAIRDTQRPATSLELLGSQWSGPCRDILSRVKDNLLYPGPSTTRKEAQCLLGVFGELKEMHIGICGSQSVLLFSAFPL